MSLLERLFGGQARAERRELGRRLAQFREEIDAARQSGGREALVRLRGRPAELGVPEEEADLEVELLEGLIEVEDLAAHAAGGGELPVVESQHRALGGETCHFAAPASRPDLASDSGGKLFLTPRRIVYIGAAQVALSWAHVAAVTATDRDLDVRARDGRHLSFRCNSFGDALRGAWLATRLHASAVRRGSAEAVIRHGRE